MPSGGARARSGPPPDPNALRRDRDASAWQRFPARRTGPLPAWPLPRPKRREKTLWAELWATGVANAWQMFGLERQVAMYVRTLAAVEVQVNNASLLGKLLQQEDRLGLTPAGQARNLWIIAAEGKVEPVVTDDETPAPRQRKPSGPTAKERLAGQGLGVLDGGA